MNALIGSIVCPLALGDGVSVCVFFFVCVCRLFLRTCEMFLMQCSVGSDLENNEGIAAEH